MKGFISEYGKVIFYFMIAFFFIGYIYLALDGAKTTVSSDVPNEVGTNEVITKKQKPNITVIKSTVIKKGIVFDPLQYVKAIDGVKTDITSIVQVYGIVDTTKKGTYDIRYTVRDTYGLFSDKKVTFVVD